MGSGKPSNKKSKSSGLVVRDGPQFPTCHFVGVVDGQPIDGAATTADGRLGLNGERVMVVLDADAIAEITDSDHVEQLRTCLRRGYQFTARCPARTWSRIEVGPG
jgi:hypothetical protein